VSRSMRSWWACKKSALFGMLAAGSVAAYFLAPDPGGITGFPIAGSGGTAMAGKMERETGHGSGALPPMDASRPGGTETATFALG